MAWNVRGVCRLLLSAALTAGAAVAAGVNLDQCANGGIGTPRLPCTGAQWQNGNLNANNSQYAEGYATSFRAQLDLPAAGAYTITVSYQTTKAGQHAYDYLQSWDGNPNTGDPCSGIAGCTGLVATSAQIPTDPVVGLAG